MGLVLLALAVPLASPDVALAQDKVIGRATPWSLRNLFFRRTPPPQQPVARPAAKPKKPVKRRPAAPRAPAAAAAAAVAAEPKIAIVEKAPGSRVLMVIGDFLAAGLADGLDAVYANDPNVRIIDRTDAGSGLVRNDQFDWSAKAAELVADEKPAAVLVMLGANDRQPMKIDGEKEPVGSDKWLAEYGARANALAERLAALKVRSLWVGMPPQKSAKATADMLAFNEIYSSAAEKAGGEFIDVWDGFVDEAGAYIASGPDINGQPVRLRLIDGVRFTFAGERKVAFYAEKPLAKILAAPNGAVALSAPGLVPAATPPVDLGAIDRTPVISLQDPELDGGQELLGGGRGATTRSPGEKLLAEGRGAVARAGRADDFGGAPVVPASAPAVPVATAAPVAPTAPAAPATAP